MLLAALLLTLMLAAGPAVAHGPVPIQPEALWRAWSFDPIVLVPLLVAHWAYGRGVLRLWARAGRWRGIGRLDVLAFLLGEAALVIALVSPLDQLGGTLLSAHMAQHALLVAVAPPLLLLGNPGAAFAWAFPAGERKGLFGSRSWRALASLANALSTPGRAAALHGLALWSGTHRGPSTPPWKANGFILWNTRRSSGRPFFSGERSWARAPRTRSPRRSARRFLPWCIARCSAPSSPCRPARCTAGTAPPSFGGYPPSRINNSQAS